MNKKILWIGGAVVGLALIVLLAASIAGEETVDESIAFGEVTVVGDPRTFLADPTSGEPARGFTAPTVSGAEARSPYTASTSVGSWPISPTTLFPSQLCANRSARESVS